MMSVKARRNTALVLLGAGIKLSLTTECVTDLDKWSEMIIFGLGQFWPLLNRGVFLEAAEAVLKIGSSLKASHHREF